MCLGWRVAHDQVQTEPGRRNRLLRKSQSFILAVEIIMINRIQSKQSKSYLEFDAVCRNSLIVVAFLYVLAYIVSFSLSLFLPVTDTMSLAPYQCQPSLSWECLLPQI